MFSTIVAWIAFVLTNLIFVMWAIVGVVNADENEITRQLYASQGYRIRTNWSKVGVVVAIWFASGYYLFG